MDGRATVFSFTTIVHGAGWNLLAQLVPAILAIALTPLLIRHLGLDQYGLLALVLAANSFLASFDGGIRPTAGRYLAVYAGAQDDAGATRFLVTFVVILISGGGLLSAGAFVLSPYLIRIFDIPHHLYPEGLFLFRTVTVLAAFALIHSLFVAVLNARHRYALTSASTVATYLVWAAGVIYLLGSGAGLRTIAILMVAQQIVASALVVPAALRYFSRADLGFLSWIELRDIFSYSIKVQLSAVSTLVNNQVDVFIIGIMLPLRYVGLYNIGATVALQTRTVISNALVPISNQMSKTFGARGEAAAYSEFERMQGAWVRICTGWFCAIGGTTFFAIEGWFGVRFAVAGYVATVLLLGYMVNMYTGMLTIYLNSSGRPGLEANYGAVSMMINLVLTAALAVVGIWGIVGATAVGTALGSAYLMVLVRKRVSSKVPNFFGAVPVGPGLLTLLISAGLAALVRPHAPSGFLGLVAVGVCCVPGLLFYAGALVGPARLVQVARGDIRAMEAARGALTGWP